MNLVKETGVPIKGIGSLLSSKEVNDINNTVNEEVAVGNAFLKTECNINAEIGNYVRQYSLKDAILLVPQDRRTPGMKIKFRNSKNTFSEYIYCGDGVSEEEWKNTDSWINGAASTIDGGEW